MTPRKLEGSVPPRGPSSQQWRRAEGKKERDRIQWSDLFAKSFDMLAKGTGEALVEGVYFGAAYDAPPLLEFSAVRKEGTGAPTVKAIGWGHPKVKIQKTQGGNIGQIDGFLADGSFETQGMFDSEIVTWDHPLHDEFPSYQKIFEDVTFVADDPRTFVGGANQWVQQPNHNRWSISSEKAHRHAMGPKGKYSAKFTFGGPSVPTGNLLAFANAGVEDGFAPLVSLYTSYDASTLNEKVWYQGWSRIGDGGTITIGSGGAGEGTRFARTTHSSGNLNDFAKWLYLIDLETAVGSGAEMDFSIQVNGDYANGEFTIEQYDAGFSQLNNITVARPGLSKSYGDWTTLPNVDLGLDANTRYLLIRLIVVVTNGESADFDDLQLSVSAPSGVGGESSEVSGWLVPIDTLSHVSPWNIPPAAVVSRLIHYYLVSYWVGVNYSRGYPAAPALFYPEGGFNTPGLVDPLCKDIAHELWVYSDQDCTLESWVTFWYDGETNVPTRHDIPEFPATHTIDYDRQDDFDVKGGEWNKIEFVSVTPSNLMPGMPFPVHQPGDRPANTYEEGHFGTMRLRVKNGRVGQKVYIDDVDVWPVLHPASDPFITVGVARWIVDDGGAYVGADVWIKVSDTIGFTVGAPSVSPPPAPAPCEDPLILGFNLLTDPGGEFQIANHTGGPNGDEIPSYTSVGPVWASDGSDAGDGVQTWFQSAFPILESEVAIVTASPRSGTYHFRFQKFDGSKATVDEGQLNWSARQMCAASAFGSWVFNTYSARCDPGNTVTWAGYYKASDIGAPDAPETSLSITFFKQDGSFNGQEVEVTDLTTSYALHSLAAVAPASTYICRVSMLYFKNSISELYVDVDSLRLGVAA